MNKQDFRIELDGNNLTIASGKAHRDEQKEDQYYSWLEFSYQSFQRSFKLPKDVLDVEQIQAKYANGVLDLVIPKEEAKQKTPRTIHIA